MSKKSTGRNKHLVVMETCTDLSFCIINYSKKSNIFVCSWLFNQMKIVTILDKLITFLELELK